MNICPICNEPATYIYCSLSCSNKARPLTVNIRKMNETKYTASPKLCKHCDAIISYDKRRNNFCSQTCGAIFNNKHFPKRTKKYREPKLSKVDKQLLDFNLGYIKTRNTLRIIISKLRGSCCDICKLASSWQDKPLTLVVDHKDGNASNNLPSNLRLLCPNCNSQTDTFSGRNKGKGRKSRGLPR